MGPLQQFTYAIRSPTTREQYQIWLRRFFKDVLVNGELDEQCIKFVKQSRKDSKWPLRQITGFLQKQRDRIDKKEVTVSTVRNYAKAIRLFCEVNEIDKYIKWKNLTRGLPNGRKWADDRTPTLEEIRKMTEYPDRRIKPIIYTMCSGGGIRRGAWDYLKWGHITSIGTDGVAKMRVYAGEDEEYWTFISPEVYKSLQGWMDFRRQSGEEITKDSWVMRQLWDAGHGRAAGFANKPEKLSAAGIRGLMESAIWAQGVRSDKLSMKPGHRRDEFQTHHGFRKFFKTRAEQVMKPIHVEMLMGHSVGVSSSYYRPSEKDLLEDYLKAVPLLTINEESAIVVEQTQHLQAQMESKDQEVQQLKELMDKLASEMQFYKREFKAYKNQFGGRSLAEKERKRIEGMLEAIKNAPDTER